MPYFIIKCERKTWTKYIVQAEDKESAQNEVDKWRYLGYVDGEDTESSVEGGAFDTEDEALSDIVSYVED
jgi:hypothetical protein